jgi:hypothetical protein
MPTALRTSVPPTTLQRRKLVEETLVDVHECLLQQAANATILIIGTAVAITTTAHCYYCRLRGRSRLVCKVLPIGLFLFCRPLAFFYYKLQLTTRLSSSLSLRCRVLPRACSALGVLLERAVYSSGSTVIFDSLDLFWGSISGDIIGSRMQE